MGPKSLTRLNHAELELLKVAARQRLSCGQGVLELDLDAAAGHRVENSVYQSAARVAP